MSRDITTIEDMEQAVKEVKGITVVGMETGVMTTLTPKSKGIRLLLTSIKYKVDWKWVNGIHKVYVLDDELWVHI